MFREHVDRSRDFLEQMTGPYDLSCVRWHVTHDWGVRLLVREHPLNSIQLCRVIVQNGIVFGRQFVLKTVSLQSRLELMQQF